MRFSHKIKVAIVATAASLAVAGAAFAYFTTSGAGSGTGTVGTSTAVTITGTAATLLYPGTSSPVTFSVNNPSPGHQYITSITLASVTAPAGCVVTDFTMPVLTVGENVPPGISSLTAQGTLTMANSAANQDLCKAAALVLTLSSL